MSCLDLLVTGMPTFDLSILKTPDDLELEFPFNLRLGHLVEKIVALLIRSSTNFNVLFENIQIIEDKKTIGELDFIIEEKSTKQLIHLELAYKFYLFDPALSLDSICNWIGPNRNDSLKEKIEKVKNKQFPLLYHDSTRSTLKTVSIDQVAQALCLLVSLYIPFDYKVNMAPEYQKGIKGYYYKLETFIAAHNESKTYYLPSKKEWGIDPSVHDTWIDFDFVKKTLEINMFEKQAPLCWQKENGSYSEFFIVWW